MCIIAAKMKNVAMPSEDTLVTMFENNPDGAGLMWAVDGHVHIEKGFMEYSDFAKKIEELGKTHNLTAIPIVMHFRIATHGGVCPDNCHPFPISDSMGMLKKRQVRTDIGVAHNGVIYIKTDDGVSDTMQYIATTLAPLRRAVPKFYKNTDLLQMIKNTTGSKLAFLDKKGEITLVGDFVHHEGIFYSNTSYEPRFYRNFNWSCFDDWNNPDKWELVSGMTRYTHAKVTWLDPAFGEYAYDEDGIAYSEAAVDEHGNIYIYDDVEGALSIAPDFYTSDAAGNPVMYNEKYAIDELIIEEY